MFNPNLINGFFDELEKISAQSEQPQMESKGPNELVTTSVLDPNGPENKNNNWETKKKGKTEKGPVAPPVSMAAKKANEVLFASDDERHPDNKLNKPVDQGSSSAAGPDRSQAPVDGQSAAGVSAGNKMNPSYGPGGV